MPSATAEQSVSAVPPHSIDAEQALLGAIFLDNAVLNDAVTIIRDAEWFYRTAHRDIFESMKRLAERGHEIDWISVREDLALHGALESAGGQDYLVQITEKMAQSAGASQWAEIVRDKAILRQVIRSATEIREEAYDPTSSPEELIEKFEGEVFRLGAARFQSDIRSVTDLMSEVQKQIEFFRQFRNDHGGVPGLGSGFTDLDRVTTGFKNGELVIMAARPGHGKTSLALNIAQHVALDAQRKRDDGKGGVAFFSLEMTTVELATRLVCSTAGVSLKDVRGGYVTPASERDLNDAQEQLATALMFIDDSFSLSMPEIRAKSRRLKDRYDIELVCVDYLQLVHADPKLDRHEQIGVITRGLKALARELNIPVVALAQLNRGIEQRRGAQQRPVLSDLRESGSIEQDADLVMFIQRDRLLDPTKRHEDQEAAQHMTDEQKHAAFDVEPATLIIAKNRSGPIDDVRLSFRKSCTRFEARMREPHEG